MPRSGDIILHPRVGKVLHVVVVAAEVGGHPVLLQQRLQLVHQLTCGAVFRHRPHYSTRVEGKVKVQQNITYYYMRGEKGQGTDTVAEKSDTGKSS